MTKYLKTTDTTGLTPHSGYHDVTDDFVLPVSDNDTYFEFVPEEEARIAAPALFGTRSGRKLGE